MRYIPHLTLLFLAVLALFIFAGGKYKEYKFSNDLSAEKKELSEKNLDINNSEEGRFISMLHRNFGPNLNSAASDIEAAISQKYDFTEDQLKKVLHNILNISSKEAQMNFLYSEVNKHNPAVNPISNDLIIDSLQGEVVPVSVSLQN